MIRAFYVCSALLALSAPAVAQAAPAPAAQAPVAQLQPMVRSTAAARDKLASTGADFSMRESVGYTQRVERAERLAAMAISGECPTAYRLALRESDEQMANNIATLCELPARDVRSMRRFYLR